MFRTEQILMAHVYWLAATSKFECDLCDCSRQYMFFALLSNNKQIKSKAATIFSLVIAVSVVRDRRIWYINEINWGKTGPNWPWRLTWYISCLWNCITQFMTISSVVSLWSFIGIRTKIAIPEIVIPSVSSKHLFIHRKFDISRGQGRDWCGLLPENRIEIRGSSSSNTSSCISSSSSSSKSKISSSRIISSSSSN